MSQIIRIWSQNYHPAFLWKLKIHKRRVHESHKYRGNQTFGMCIRTNLLRRKYRKKQYRDTRDKISCLIVCFYANLLKFLRFFFFFRKVESIRITSSHRSFHPSSKEGIKSLNLHPAQLHHVGRHSFNCQRHSPVSLTSLIKQVTKKKAMPQPKKIDKSRDAWH